MAIKDTANIDESINQRRRHVYHSSPTASAPFVPTAAPFQLPGILFIPACINSWSNISCIRESITQRGPVCRGFEPSGQRARVAEGTEMTDAVAFIDDLF
ncbi:hypothetical protein Agabi119p4_3699 [Agaricus bisporus var. burnettii]|uniref:Uncharacterized protein n=1 Tax=Agaricus bisporus var. burnettii TaxID=192524 RepID=A0A8H7F572_AGABI|nr:hypothetical protein Agabi119p4_3699 [Agaricus bisporus var. burnettii]